MVRVDRDLKRCYFYRIKINGDVRKPSELGGESPEFPRSGTPRQDIIPYNPHFRKRASRQTSRPTSNRRISWSREADRVREISPRSEPEKIFYPPPAREARRHSDNWRAPELEEKPRETLETKNPKKKKKAIVKKSASTPRIITPPSPEPFFESPIYAPSKPLPKQKIAPKTNSKSKPKVKSSSKTNNDQIIRQQRDKRYQAQKLEQNRRKTQSNSNLRKVKSETNLKAIPKEPLMKKSDMGKSKHANPPRWRHVGDRTRHRQLDKNTRSFASDYYF